jgi:hypothetical protein
VDKIYLEEITIMRAQIRRAAVNRNAAVGCHRASALEQVSENVFKFPDRGLYDGERLIFTRDKTVRATQVKEAGVVFKRRSIGPEEGTGQLRIKPLRPVSELLKGALAATPPKEAGEFTKPDLVELNRLDPTIKVDVRYATTNNFLGSVFYIEPSISTDAGLACYYNSSKFHPRRA